MTLLAAILFYVVFILLFIALALYLGATVYTFFKKERRKKDRPTKKADQPEEPS